jgi:hypothetical protein
MFAINYSLVSAPSGPAAAAPAARAAAAAAADRLVIESPDQVSAGSRIEVPLRIEGTGAVRALSARLTWDASVVEPVGQATGELLAQLGGVALSARPGTVDAAAFGAGAGLIGTGTLATVTFKAIGSGDPMIRIGGVDARDHRNRAVTVGTARDVPAADAPKVTTLQMAMPNPFRETVTLSVSLAQRLPMELGIYSVDGRRVRTLAKGERDPGNYRFTWDGRDESGNPMAAGIFYARFTAGRSEFTRKMTYLR